MFRRKIVVRWARNATTRLGRAKLCSATTGHQAKSYGVGFRLRHDSDGYLGQQGTTVVAAEVVKAEAVVARAARSKGQGLGRQRIGLTDHIGLVRGAQSDTHRIRAPVALVADDIETHGVRHARSRL